MAPAPSLLNSKKGQLSTYSPRTHDASRTRFGSFFSSIVSLSSPLGGRSSTAAVELPDSPLKARIYRRGGPEGSEEELGRDLADVRLTSPRAAEGSRRRGGRGAIDSAVDFPEARVGDEGRITILDLPDDLILLILEHLPPSARHLHTVSLVSRRFFEYAQTPALWAGLYRATPGYRLSEDAMRYGIASDTPPAGAAGWYHLDRSTGPGSTPLSTPSRKSLTPANPSSSPSAPKSSPNREIPIHYPTLYRSRYTLSHAVRRPSPEYRSHTESLKEHSDSVYCIKSSGRWLLTGSRDRSIHIWRLGEYDELGQVGETALVKMEYDAHEASVLCLDFELDREGRGTMVTGSSDRTVKIWSVTIPGDSDAGLPLSRLQSTLSGHTNGVLDVVLSKTHIISCSKDGSIRIYDRETYALLHEISAHVQSVNALGISTDGKTVASASGDGTWAIWDIASGKEVRREGDRKGPGMACLAWQGEYVAVGDNARNVSIYSANTGELLRVCRGHTDLVRAVSIVAEEGLVASGSYDGSVRIWDLHTGVMIRNIPGPELIFDIHLKPNKLLVAREDGTIQVISLVTALPYLNLMVGE